MAPNRLCLITALAPVPAFLGGSCPLGCSLNAPAAGGFSVVSLQCNMYAAGSEKEKRAGCPLHGDIIAQPFVSCKGGGAEASPEAGGRDWGWVGLLWPAPSFSGGSGLACAVVPPARPPTFLGTGGLPLYPRRGLRAPCTLLGRRTGLCLIVCVTAFSSPPALRRRGAVTKALQAVTRALRVVTKLLRVVTEPDGSRKPVPYNGIHSGPNLPRRVLPLGLFPQRSCHRGILCG